MAEEFTSLMLGVAAIVLVVMLVMAGYYLWKGLRRQKTLVKKYGYVPSDMELYFEEYFGTMVRNWDLMTHSKVDDWSAGMSKRLDSVGKEIGKLTAFTKGVNTRLDNLEKLVDRLEKS